MKVELERRRFGRSAPVIPKEDGSAENKLLSGKSDTLERLKLGFVYLEFLLLILFKYSI